jgi:hypothetical protein
MAVRKEMCMETCLETIRRENIIVVLKVTVDLPSTMSDIIDLAELQGRFRCRVVFQ